MAVDVQLLGAVVVSAESGKRSIDAPLARRCLAALALAPGSVTLDGLADALWGDGLPANWKPSLRNVVAKLRQRLEPIGGSSGAVIVTTPTGYRLAAGCTVDVHALLDVVNEAQEALARGDPDSALELANPAMDRWAGRCWPTSKPTG